MDVIHATSDAGDANERPVAEVTFSSRGWVDMLTLVEEGPSQLIAGNPAGGGTREPERKNRVERSVTTDQAVIIKVLPAIPVKRVDDGTPAEATGIDGAGDLSATKRPANHKVSGGEGQSGEAAGDGEKERKEKREDVPPTSQSGHTIHKRWVTDATNEKPS